MRHAHSTRAGAICWRQRQVLQARLQELQADQAREEDREEDRPGRPRGQRGGRKFPSSGGLWRPSPLDCLSAGGNVQEKSAGPRGIRGELRSGQAHQAPESERGAARGRGRRVSCAAQAFCGRVRRGLVGYRGARQVVRASWEAGQEDRVQDQERKRCLQHHFQAVKGGENGRNPVRNPFANRKLWRQSADLKRVQPRKPPPFSLAERMGPLL
mmetsp:Transcript_15680/g.39905  ORF Transcript_15680/g.39905 Transcript_15680/m.39905 type:complete len:213 (-) Transcript_15680:1447-2085(-)